MFLMPPLEKTIDTTQKVQLTLAGKTSSGSNVEIQAVAWSRTSGEATVIPQNPAGNAQFVSSPEVGESVFLAQVTADFGSGITTAKQEIKISVVESGTLPEGASLVGVFGVPTAK